MLLLSHSATVHALQTSSCVLFSCFSGSPPPRRLEAKLQPLSVASATDFVLLPSRLNAYVCAPPSLCTVLYISLLFLLIFNLAYVWWRCSPLVCKERRVVEQLC